MKKLTATLLLLSLFISLSSCKPADSSKAEETQESIANATEETEKTEMKKHEISMNALRTADKIKMLGQTDADGNGVICDDSLSGFEINLCFTGELKLTVTTKTNTVAPCGPNDVYFTVYVDGVRSETRLCYPEDATTTLTVAESNGEQIHHIRILKQTQPYFALATLESLAFTGYIAEKPANKDFYIEAIGDSIAAGWGTLTKRGDIAADQPLYEDATRTAFFLIAEELSADIALTACSGIGAVCGNLPFAMPEFYAAQSYFRDQSAKRVTERTPDLILISLGTNDKLVAAVPDDEFKDGILLFIDSLRDRYGSVPVVLIYGQMTRKLDTVMPEIAAGADDVYVYKLARNEEGGGGHPSIEGNLAARDEILALLRRDELVPN